MENTKNGFDVFKEKICRYNAVAQVLHESKNIEMEHDFLEKASDTEYEILNSFGLPCTAEYRGLLDLFCWAGNMHDTDIENLHSRLKEIAADYLLLPAKSDKAFLAESKEKHLTAFDVFPIIGVESIGYNIFLYESLFYTLDYPVEVVSEEMKKGNTIPVDMVKKMNAPSFIKGKPDDEIAGFGLKFLDEFIAYESIIKRKPAKRLMQLLDSSRHEWHGVYPKKFFFDSGYISGIALKKTDDPYVCVEIATHFDLRWMNIHVYMPFDEVIKLLKKATNKSISCMVRSMLFEQLKDILPDGYDLTIRECYDSYLFCEGFDWTVSLLALEDEKGHVIEDHNYYELVQY